MKFMTNRPSFFLILQSVQPRYSERKILFTADTNILNFVANGLQKGKYKDQILIAALYRLSLSTFFSLTRTYLAQLAVTKWSSTIFFLLIAFCTYTYFSCKKVQVKQKAMQKKVCSSLVMICKAISNAEKIFNGCKNKHEHI